MACLSSYATAAEYSQWWGYWQHKIDLGDLTPTEITALERQIEMAAGDINMALSQVGACDCTLSAYAVQYLKKINILSTAVVYRVPCGPRLSDDERAKWLEWIDAQLTMIREGKLEVCDGETGADFPAFGTAEIGWTEDNALQIIDNTIKRTTP